MLNRKRIRRLLAAAIVVAILTTSQRESDAYIEASFALGAVVSQATNVCVVRVEKVDREKNLIVYRKVKDVKGTHSGDVIKHNIGFGGFHPREWQTIMKWAEPGKTALFFHNGGASETCIDNYWYQAYAGGEWWSMSHGEPFLLRTFAGKPSKLETAVTAMLAGQEIVVPCMVDGDKNALHEGRAKMQRLKASLKLQEYNSARDFVGWGGGEDFRRVSGMPGFSHISTLSRVDPGAGGIAPADFDGDKKLDLCLYGESRVVLLKNDGTSLNETSIPYSGGARSADWADYNGDGKPDLLLATPQGPKLLTNQGGAFKDTSGGLPQERYYNTTSACWLDYDGDKRPDIVLANGFLGLRLYRNLGPTAAGAKKAPAVGPWHFIGPFDNTGGRGFDAVYPPEMGVDFAAEYHGKLDEKVAWKSSNFQDGQVQSLAIFGKPELNNDAVVYLYREFDFGGAVEVPVSLGSDDTLTVWLNGEKILAENVYRGAAADQNQLTLKLRPGKNKLLLKICQGSGEFAFYFLAKTPTEPVPPLFEDVSAAAKLGQDGIGGKIKGDHLAVADWDGDGRSDFLYCAGGGLVVLNTPSGFVEVANCGLNFVSGCGRPAVGDFDGDKRPDLFVPQRDGGKLYKNAGGGKFVDVTAGAGDLARPIRSATSAAWVDLSGGGKPDLLVGCLTGANRVFRNGDGKFVEIGGDLGLNQKVFGTRGVCGLDLNGDGEADLVLNNEGQDPAVLLGAKKEKTAAGSGGGK
ncbi:MAG: VCBS repeat-containing protein [Planctomycetia bacterium]|nr:VCBS repeat-containing protein [Planctomycetia bacterium]